MGLCFLLSLVLPQSRPLNILCLVAFVAATPIGVIVGCFIARGGPSFPLFHLNR